ncbi:unnamed protein product [Prorocentrum cordatum]|uniref:Ubiquitin-like domain-containing protein n=1 Tax=Prorocentrum cordatum TaxID=2364126 RepID=A0ABN9UQI5_9DINO|nr:unnamed protein product [Polarella glacialis]
MLCNEHQKIRSVDLARCSVFEFVSAPVAGRFVAPVAPALGKGPLLVFVKYMGKTVEHHVHEDATVGGLAQLVSQRCGDSVLAITPSIVHHGPECGSVTIEWLSMAGSVLTKTTTRTSESIGSLRARVAERLWTPVHRLRLCLSDGRLLEIMEDDLVLSGDRLCEAGRCPEEGRRVSEKWSLARALGVGDCGGPPGPERLPWQLFCDPAVGQWWRRSDEDWFLSFSGSKSSVDLWSPTWRRFKSPDDESYWWFRARDGEYFLEPTDSGAGQRQAWKKYTPLVGRSFWMRSREDWFFIDTGLKLPADHPFGGDARLRWQRFQSPDGVAFGWFRDVDGEWFWEDTGSC